MASTASSSTATTTTRATPGRSSTACSRRQPVPGRIGWRRAEGMSRQGRGGPGSSELRLGGPDQGDRELAHGSI